MKYSSNNFATYVCFLKLHFIIFFDEIKLNIKKKVTKKSIRERALKSNKKRTIKIITIEKSSINNLKLLSTVIYISVFRVDISKNSEEFFRKNTSKD